MAGSSSCAGRPRSFSDQRSLLSGGGHVRAAQSFWRFSESQRAAGHRRAPRPAAAAFGRLWTLLRTRRLSAVNAAALLTGRWPWLLLAGGAALLLTAGLLFSWSRGAWLGFAAGLAALALFTPARLRTGILLALLGGGLFWVAVSSGLLPAGLTDRLFGWLADFRLSDVRGVDITDANFAIIERLAHWQVALDLAREQFWFGVGAGNYEARYAQYALLNWPNALGHAHNYYLNLIAETGIIGLLAYGMLWSTILWQTIKTARGLQGPERGLALGLLGAWVALSVHHLLDKLYVNNIYLHLGVMLGLLQILHQRARELVS